MDTMRVCLVAAAAALLQGIYAFGFVCINIKNPHQFLGTITSSSALHQTPAPWERAGETAGTGGYSILRQPVQWDPNEVPSFEAPKRLDEVDKPLFGKNDDPIEGERTSLKNGESPNLDLFHRTLETLDYHVILNALSECCATAPGRLLVQNAWTTPVNMDQIPKRYSGAYESMTAVSLEGMQDRYRAVEEIRTITDFTKERYVDRKGKKVSMGLPPFNGLTFDMKEIYEKAENGLVLVKEEIEEVAFTLDTFLDLQCWAEGLENLENHEFSILPKMIERIDVNKTLQELLHNAFDDDGFLNGGTFPEIGRLRNLIKSKKTQIIQRVGELLAEPGIRSKMALESGGPSYSEVNGRIAIPIHQDLFTPDDGIVQDSSRSGKTVYVEPLEVVEMTNVLRGIENQLRVTEAKTWRFLTTSILRNKEPILASAMVAGQLDLTLARVALGERFQGGIPEIGNEAIVRIENGRHPVLLLKGQEEVVGNDVFLDEKRALILSGPNAGGKTIILKLVGVMSLMAQQGIPVPASSSRIDYFDTILADIGDTQSVMESLSTFSGHMLVCREFLKKATGNSLLLLDELGSGTDPQPGSTIAQAIVEALVDKGARVVLTTHFPQIKQLAVSDSRFQIAGMEFSKGKPTYKLLIGRVAESFAISVLERLDFPVDITNRANELLDSDSRYIGELLQQLEEEKSTLEDTILDYEGKQTEVKRTELKLREKELKLEEKKQSIRKVVAAEFAEKLTEKEKMLEEILDRLKQDPSQKVIAKSWDDVQLVKREVLNDAAGDQPQKMYQSSWNVEDLETLTASEARDLKNGDTLFVSKQGVFYGAKVIVEYVERGKVTVSYNGLTTSMKTKDLCLPPEGMRSSGGSKKKSGNRTTSNLKGVKGIEKVLELDRLGSAESTPTKQTTVKPLGMRTESNTIDVRGCNFMEAEEVIRSKLNKKVIYVLHGQGEKAVLKKKIRNWLKGQEGKLIARAVPADMADGGDSFTRVEVR